MDPEFAAALAEEAANTPIPSGPPTIEQIRASFVQHVITPHKTYHEQRLPPGESQQSLWYQFRVTHASRFLASSYILQDKRIPGNGGNILVRCVTPAVEDGNKKFPVLVYVHGGCTYTYLGFVRKSHWITDGSLRTRRSRWEHRVGRLSSAPSDR